MWLLCVLEIYIILLELLKVVFSCWFDDCEYNVLLIFRPKEFVAIIYNIIIDCV